MPCLLTLNGMDAIKDEYTQNQLSERTRKTFKKL